MKDYKFKNPMVELNTKSDVEQVRLAILTILKTLLYKIVLNCSSHLIEAMFSLYKDLTKVKWVFING